MDGAWLIDLAGSPLLYPALFLLVVGDAFLVVLPSETAVVALGALAASTGHPHVGLIVAVAAVGAVVGDCACFFIGSRVGLERWGWQSRGRIGVAVARIRATILQRTAVLVFTARYIPFARIAVNLTAGASGVSPRRFIPLSAVAGVSWAVYNVAIGSLFGAIMPETPLFAIACSIVVAALLGLAVDGAIRLRSRSKWKRQEH
jgi:membrane protein DedA with SNARE-associated domain